MNRLGDFDNDITGPLVEAGQKSQFRHFPGAMPPQPGINVRP